MGDVSAHEPVTAQGETAFRVDLDGFEGPLDLLLELARRQKVDLAKISILALAEQYLGFIEAAQGLRLELAADYLVMAAWMAYLKSQLLLPAPPRGDEPDAATLALDLALRLRQLDAIRKVAGHLGTRPQLGRDFFMRTGAASDNEPPEAPRQASLYDLLSAYAALRQKAARPSVVLQARQVWSIARARAALEDIAALTLDWSVLDECLRAYCKSAPVTRTMRASTFAVSLEMVRQGRIGLRQDGAFAPIYLRASPAPVP
ncbi:MAG: segregation/condensation protein A [Hyphomicrobiales bacterium]|nr:segregation/condensation protein A [Hyphomicrobiales bacterium]